VYKTNGFNMIVRSYYQDGALSGIIEITRMVDSKPAQYHMCLIHSINGVLLKQDFDSAEKAFSKATTIGYTRTKWDTKETKL
jgi:hypothetical protein